MLLLTTTYSDTLCSPSTTTRVTAFHPFAITNGLWGVAAKTFGVARKSMKNSTILSLNGLCGCLASTGWTSASHKIFIAVMTTTMSAMSFAKMNMSHVAVRKE